MSESISESQFESQSVFYTDVTFEKCSITWIVNNFTLLNKATAERLVSPVHEMKLNKEIKWRLILYPRGLKLEETKLAPTEWISLFLRVESSSKDVRVQVNYRLSIVDHSNIIVYTKESGQLFEKTSQAFGFELFIKRDNLLKNKETWLLNDTLRILCSFDVGLESSTLKKNQLIAKTSSYSSQTLESFFLNDEFSDFTLIVEDQKLRVHKVILAGHSDVFKAMFKHNVTGMNKNVLTIPDIPLEIFRELLRFIYTGRIEVISDNVGRLLAAAQRYRINGLKDKCQRILESNLTRDNALLLSTKVNNSETENQLKVKKLQMNYDHLQG